MVDEDSWRDEVKDFDISDLDVFGMENSSFYMAAEEDEDLDLNLSEEDWEKLGVFNRAYNLSKEQEEELHQAIMSKGTEGIDIPKGADMKEIMYQILKNDNGLIEQLRKIVSNLTDIS